eukprot:CAMPEP_0171808738 /NCGR_PEP_ID=MMETSP0991-20121206/76562_1 /TAXON_ID=483369 /ORGANISM="non described non described, Strain CCMP2098" /LENGTH=650 /DNA_ID=CAMNT_0012421713 /DNA_START=28 /DNA_END=1980 /DNA_ORIENTATION=-
MWRSIIATFLATMVFSTAFSLPRWAGPMKALSSRTKSFMWGVSAAVVEESPACANPVEVLGENANLLSQEQLDLAAKLLTLQQEHLFVEWPRLGTEDQAKIGLMEQLEAVDQSYPGGLELYVGKARELLASSAAGENPFEGFTPAVPSGEDLLYGDEEYQSMEALGLEAAARLGFVLVAGGLGERLGYSGIKVELPVDLASERSFLKMYAAWILGLQQRCRDATGDHTLQIPLAIMTSGDTDAPTRALLESESFMGLSRSQVTVLMQDKVPALSDNLARLVTKKGDRWRLETKPHGHGDVHHLLHRSGLARKWLKELGKEWVFFFQDTNPLVTHALLPMLGVSVDRKYDMNSLCVPRRAGEAAGAITKLTHSDGATITINVEYNQLDPLLRATPGFEGGDVDDPETGFSPFPGNVNNLLVYLPTYEKAVSGPDEGVVEEFVNPKYADASRTTFKKPTRLECMMQDLPKLMAKELPDANVGFTTMERWLTFSPAKNAPDAGAAAALAGSPPGSPASSEADVYGAIRVILGKATGAQVEEGVESVFAGMPVTLLPAVQLDPAFAVTSSDGALVVKCSVPGATLTVENLSVSNQGWEFVPAEVGESSESVPEVFRIRGYKLLKHEAMVIEVTQPGDWVVGSDGVLNKKVKATS